MKNTKNTMTLNKFSAAVLITAGVLTASLPIYAAQISGTVQENSGAAIVQSEYTAARGPMGGQINGQINGQTNGQMPGGPMNGMNGGFNGGMGGGMAVNTNPTYAEEATEVVTSTVVNTASSLSADEQNATTIEMSDSDSQVEIDLAGTYVITGSCSDGNITVKKGTTGVVLILSDLDLTSTTGATLSLNKGSEVKIVIEGTVTLTDAEDPADETSTDTEVADAFDGAVIKAKDGSNVCLTGDGTLILNGECKNGIKVGDADEPSFVIDGDLSIEITAADDAINAGYDISILSGTITINAEDDAIHADRILTLGSKDGTGPVVNIKNSGEGLEGTVVNIFGGDITVNSSDDGINVANKNATYSSELDYSINVTGGTVTVNCPQGDGLDSNGNINLIGGTIVINSASNGGEAGIDYIGSCYVSDDVNLTNNSGVSFDSGMGGMGHMGGNDGMQGFGRNANAQGTEESADATSSATEKQAPAQSGSDANSTNPMPGQAPDGNQMQPGSMPQNGMQPGFGQNGGGRGGFMPGMNGGFQGNGDMGGQNP